MSKIAVIYWSGTGNTQQMAEAIANQAHADLFTASEFTADKAANYDAFAFGCSAMGAEQLEEDEFEPMWNAVAPCWAARRWCCSAATAGAAASGWTFGSVITRG